MYSVTFLTFLNLVVNLCTVAIFNIMKHSIFRAQHICNFVLLVTVSVKSKCLLLDAELLPRRLGFVPRQLCQHSLELLGCHDYDRAWFVGGVIRAVSMESQQDGGFEQVNTTFV